MLGPPPSTGPLGITRVRMAKRLSLLAEAFPSCGALLPLQAQMSLHIVPNWCLKLGQVAHTPIPVWLRARRLVLLPPRSRSPAPWPRAPGPGPMGP